MAFTEWKSTRSDGTLPLDSPAGQFQYSHFIHWQTFQAFGAGMGRVGRGSWEIEIVEPGGKVLFRQKVTIAITVMFFGMMGFSSMVWMYYDGGEEFDTTIVHGQEITEDNPSWSYTIGNSPLSEFGTLIPGGGESPISTVEATWTSPVYRTRLPIGSKLRVISDHWGLGVSTRPEWRFRFGEAEEGKVAVAMDTFNQMNTIAPVSDLTPRLGANRAWPDYLQPKLYSDFEGDSPSMDVDGTGMIRVVLQDAGVLRLYESDDAMRSWREVHGIFLPEGREVPQVINLKSGAFVVMAKQSGGVHKYTYSNPYGQYHIGTFRARGETVQLTEDESGRVFAIDETGVIAAISIDGGHTFDETPEAEGGE